MGTCIFLVKPDDCIGLKAIHAFQYPQKIQLNYNTCGGGGVYLPLGYKSLRGLGIKIYQPATYTIATSLCHQLITEQRNYH